jgi:cyclic beta-1,2-glucan synthetase
LFGSGDWNDGMNRVGIRGRGESVWLAWFLAATLTAFAPVCERRGHADRARELRRRADRVVAAIERHAWDGAWYRRGFYDDGTPLGSARSDECRVDAVAQSWAVISGLADPGRAAVALASVFRLLADRDLELLRLFDPPFDHTRHDPGYVMAYPPGVRENGGQYTHAALWTAWAAGLAGDGDRLGELFRWLNPIHRTASPELVARYRGEPYAVAADRSTAAAVRGVAGWTWYTGSAAWMYRLGLEVLLGLRRERDGLRIDPCVPRDWTGFEATWRHGDAEYRIRVRNPHGVRRGVAAVTLDGAALDDTTVPLRDEAGVHVVDVVLGERG